MFINERHEKILEYLDINQQANVSDLSNLLDVSEVTIRKDLRNLENNGQIERTYGGAILSNKTHSYKSSCYVSPDSLDDYNAKQTIGELAAELVSNEDFLFLGPGYTCLEVAKNLKGKKRLSIMTMNVSAAIELADTPEFKLITVPGDFTKRNGTYYVTGPLLFDYFSDKHFDKIFLTIDGFSAERGYSVLDDTTAKIFQPLLKQTKEVIICTTTSKLQKNAMALLGPLGLATAIVMEKAPTEEYLELFNQYNIKLIHA